jgi:23S rRNA (uracil1939-C5)-methyltransferase
VIVDPPRSGLDATSLAQILQLAPKEILYISCNPETQAQNVKVFIENGYKLLELQPVDQFPHTPHLETIARLASN